MKNIVFRIEHPSDGIGPYQFTNPDGGGRLAELKPIRTKLQNAHCDDNRNHPVIWEDVRGFIEANAVHKYLRCGFDTLAQLTEWFDGFLDELHSVGYVVAVYQYTHRMTGLSGKQLAFAGKRIASVAIPDMHSILVS